LPSGNKCQANSFDNGLGYCVCNQGYYLSGGVCVAGTPCPANSTRQSNGSCVCNAGLTNYSNFCSQCPAGALWSSVSSKCIFVCGQNAVYSTTSNACVCQSGYGLLSGVCQQCPNGYFVTNGYCVTCPLFSSYNSVSKSCECQTGYYTNPSGICVKTCGTNEVYSNDAQACICVNGLGRVNGACQVCPAGSTPTTNGASCSFCDDNQVLVNGYCVCKSGFARNSAGICTACASIPGSFVINGVCSVCPGSLIYDGVSTCRCPAGKTAKGSQCISQCQSD